ncbi:MAG TPA: ABC transporter substrate-binding protein [Eubacteriales bacterium]|nr:ABC transporter substrate-binding protein [Eubacteriales bacterium]
MKHLKILAVPLVLALAFAALFGCAQDPKADVAATDEPVAAFTNEPVSQVTDAPVEAPSEVPTAEPVDNSVTVTDMMGREITLTEPATRIVALTAADCEILYAIGAGDTLVGRGEYCDYPPEVLEVPSVQSGYETNVEQIIALEPQVLLMSTMSQAEEQVAIFEAAGIAVVVSNAQDIEGVYTAVTMIGALMGKDDEAAVVVESMRTTFSEVEANSTGDGTETIYFEVSPLEWGLWTAGSGTFMNEIAKMLGLTNIFADVEGWAAISEEQVIERNPDYIVTISMYYGEGPTPVEEILARTGWEGITAVKNGAILNLVNNELSRPCPRLADGAQLLFDFVYNKETPAA